MKKIVSLLVACAFFTVAVFPVNAAPTVSSVEAKEAPTISEIVVPEGFSVDVEAIVVTPLSQSEALDEGSQEVIEAVFESINEAETIVEVAPALLEVIPEDVNVEDLKVTDLFDLYLPEDVYELFEANESITIDFALTTVATSDVYVMVLCDGDGEWTTVPNESVVLSEDGSSISVTFTELCPIAFVSASAEEADSDVEGEESDTADNNSDAYMYGIIAAGCAAVAVGLVVTRKKESK